jgi:hypothetical protein
MRFTKIAFSKTKKLTAGPCPSIMKNSVFQTFNCKICSTYLHVIDQTVILWMNLPPTMYNGELFIA